MRGNMRKVCVVITARASYGKVKPILSAIAAHPDLELQLVCAASMVLERFGAADKLIERDGFKIDERIFMVLEEANLLTSAKSTGIGVVEFAGAFDRLKPDVVLLMADRYEVIAPAIAASYMNIPIAHAQGGEVSGNIDEKVRHAVTKLSDIHFPSTRRARDWIVRMGENPEKVFFTGCPSIDIVKEILKKPALDFDPYERYGGVGEKPDLSKGYIIVMQHPVTTEFEDSRRHVDETLKAVVQFDRPVLWFWPNIDAGSDATSKGIRAFRENNDVPHLHFFKNMEPEDFLRLLYNGHGIVGNSSVAIRECSYMGVPAVNIGSRQSDRDRGPNVIDVDYDAGKILEAIRSHCGSKKCPSAEIYGAGDASRQIADLLAKTPLSFSKVLNYVKDEKVGEGKNTPDKAA